MLPLTHTGSFCSKGSGSQPLCNVHCHILSASTVMSAEGKDQLSLFFLYGLILWFGVFFFFVVGFFSFIPPFLAAFVVYLVREQTVSGWFQFCGAFQEGDCQPGQNKRTGPAALSKLIYGCVSKSSLLFFSFCSCSPQITVGSLILTSSVGEDQIHCPIFMWSGEKHTCLPWKGGAGQADAPQFMVSQASFSFSLICLWRTHQLEGINATQFVCDLNEIK